MADESTSVSAVVPAHDAEVTVVPAGWVLLYDENGKAAMIQEKDRAEWERKHGLITEQYDIPSAHSRWVAAYNAVGPVVEQAMQEFASFGFIRDEMAAALNMAQGEFVDSYRWLMRCAGALLPTETQVADMARLKQTGEIVNVAATLRSQLEPLVEKLPSGSLDSHLARIAADAAARAN